MKEFSMEDLEKEIEEVKEDIKRLKKLKDSMPELILILSKKLDGLIAEYNKLKAKGGQ